MEKFKVFLDKVYCNNQNEYSIQDEFSILNDTDSNLDKNLQIGKEQFIDLCRVG